MTELDEALKQYYSEWWENPRDIRNVVFARLNEYVRHRIPEGHGKKALDIGSGHGRIVSFLVEKGYQVTAVEFNPEFASEIRKRFPGVRVIEEDVRKLDMKDHYDLVTCIELVQNLIEPDFRLLLAKLSAVTESLLINISNRQSIHGRWIALRHFAASFVFDYTPTQFDKCLNDAGFNIVHRRGIGLVTPVSLFKNFRGKVVPIWLARVANKLDPLFTRSCHLYYIEASGRNI